MPGSTRARDRVVAPRSRPPTLLRSLALRNLRGYASLDLTLGPGPQLVWGPNAAGKTTLLEAIVLLALGRSHRTGADAELIRWGTDFLRVEGVVGIAGAEEEEAEGVALDVSVQAGGRKRIQVNGVPRRPAALAEQLRTVLFAPEEMLLVGAFNGSIRSNGYTNVNSKSMRIFSRRSVLNLSQKGLIRTHTSGSTTNRSVQRQICLSSIGLM